MPTSCLLYTRTAVRLLLLLLGLSGTTEAVLPGIKVVSLRPQGRADYSGCRFGAATALTERWAVVMESPFSQDSAAHVYDATTGRYLRTLRHKTAQGSPLFLSVHVQENRALIGMSLPGGLLGKAVLYDLITGAEVMQFAGLTGRTTFGGSVRLQDEFAIIGAPGTASQAGAVFIHYAATGALKQTLSAPIQANGDAFGAALYSVPGTVVIGAPGHGGGNGAVMIANLGSGLGTMNSNLGTGVRFGQSLSGSGNWVCVGSQESANILRGRVYPLRLDSVGGGYNAIGFSGAENFLRGVLAQDGSLIASAYDGTAIEFFDASNGFTASHLHTMEREEIGVNFLSSLQLASGRMLVADQYGTFNGMSQAGTAFLVLGLTTPLKVREVGTTGSWMAGLGNAVVTSLHESTVTPDGWPHLVSATAGPDSDRGRDVGLWLGAGTAGEILHSKSRDSYLNLRRGAPGRLLSNNTFRSVYQVTLTGPGVAPHNNRLICSAKMPDIKAVLFRTGTSIPGAGVVSSLRHIAQSSGYDAILASVSFRAGEAGVTAANDSGVFEMNTATGLFNQVIKESSLPPGLTDAHGQFLPRSAFASNASSYVSALLGDPAASQGLFVKRYNMPEVLVARRGAPASGVTGAFFSSFLGETIGAFTSALFRATMTGPGITSANNEGVWVRTGDASSTTLAARKGDQVPGMAPGVKWLRFLRCAPFRTQSGVIGTLIHARISGPGVTASNNEIFFSSQVAGTQMVLLRKGDLAPGCHGARIASLQNIVTAGDSHYAMLVSLRGCPADTNQAVLVGDADFGGPASSWAGRRPHLRLRKGALIASGLDVSSRVTSLSFPNSGLTDSTGFLNNGLGNVLGVSTSGNTTTVSLVVRAGFGRLGSAVLRLQ
jgi:hypothetical protein